MCKISSANVAISETAKENRKKVKQRTSGVI